MSDTLNFIEIIFQSDFKSYLSEVTLHNSARLEHLLIHAINFPASWLISIIKGIYSDF